MLIGEMQKGAAGPQDMKESMAMGVDGMQKMPMSGNLPHKRPVVRRYF